MDLITLHCHVFFTSIHFALNHSSSSSPPSTTTIVSSNSAFLAIFEKASSRVASPRWIFAILKRDCNLIRVPMKQSIPFVTNPIRSLNVFASSIECVLKKNAHHFFCFLYCFPHTSPCFFIQTSFLQIKREFHKKQIH